MTNRRTTRWLVAAWTLGLTAACASATVAAEIQLRRECRATSGLVTLGDVAELRTVAAAEAEALAAIELMPAPAPGRQRPLGVAEVRQALARHGVNLTQYRFSGASVVLVSAPEPVAAPVEAPRTAGQLEMARRRVEQHLRVTVESFLSAQGVAMNGVELQLELPADAPFATLATVDGWQLSGGQSPWTGRQEFLATGTAPEGPVQLAFRVDVSQPTFVVVVVASIPRGAILQESDLVLAPLTSAAAGEKYFTSIDEVVGHEAVQALAEGRPVTQRSVRAPLLVKRGEIVTVRARSGGITVETTGRAKSDGSLGAVIGIESLTDKQSFFARVAGVQQVEVYARATRPTPPAAGVGLPAPQQTAPAAALAAPIASPAAPIVQDRVTPAAASAPIAPDAVPAAEAAPRAPTWTPAAKSPADDSTLRWVKRKPR